MLLEPSCKAHSLNVSYRKAAPSLNEAFSQDKPQPFSAGRRIQSECAFLHFGALKFPVGRHLNVSSGKTRVYGTVM